MPEAKQSPSNQNPTEDTVRSPLVTEMGSTTIAENVVASFTESYARDNPGVRDTTPHAAPSTPSPTASPARRPTSPAECPWRRVRSRPPSTSPSSSSTAPLSNEVAEAIRRNVIRAVEQGTGLQVVEVNIDVTDVHLPEDDEEAPAKDSPELN